MNPVKVSIAAQVFITVSLTIFCIALFAVAFITRNLPTSAAIAALFALPSALLNTWPLLISKRPAIYSISIVLNMCIALFIGIALGKNASKAISGVYDDVSTLIDAIILAIITCLGGIIGLSILRQSVKS